MNTILFGDCRTSLATFRAFGVKAQTCITSPPYFGLRSYLPDGHADKDLEIGAEETPEQFVTGLVEVFRGVRDVLADDGTLWVNIGDRYAGSWGNQGRKEGRGTQREINAPMLQNVAEGKYVSADATGTGSLARTPGCKNKDLIGIPWMLAFALRADGWFLRQEIIWAKAESGEERAGRCMPESVRDRFTKAHEHIFLLSKSPTYYFDADAVKEPAKDWGKDRDRSKMRGGTTDPKLKHGGLDKVNHTMGNRRSVWKVTPGGVKGAHFAVFPHALIEPCVLAGSRPGDIVLDPFMGSGTTAGVALKHGRQYIGCELNREYEALQADRIAQIISA